MKLPIIESSSSSAGIDVIVRAIKKANASACSQSSTQTDLSGAAAYHHPSFKNIWDANIVYDLRLPEETTPENLIAEIENHFADNNVTCFNWVPNDLTLDPALASALKKQGLREKSSLCMQLINSLNPEPPRNDLQIIPARAMRTEYRELSRISHIHDWDESSADNMADFQLNALDDPKLDMFIARLDKQVVAAGGVYTVGEIALLWDIVTHPEHRRKGIMASFLHAVLDHAARCQAKTIALETEPDNAPAINLYRSFGFDKLTEFQTFTRTPDPISPPIMNPR